MELASVPVPEEFVNKGSFLGWKHTCVLNQLSRILKLVYLRRKKPAFK